MFKKLVEILQYLAHLSGILLKCEVLQLLLTSALGHAVDWQLVLPFANRLLFVTSFKFSPFSFLYCCLSDCCLP